MKPGKIISIILKPYRGLNYISLHDSLFRIELIPILQIKHYM